MPKFFGGCMSKQQSAEDAILPAHSILELDTNILLGYNKMEFSEGGVVPFSSSPFAEYTYFIYCYASHLGKPFNIRASFDSKVYTLNVYASNNSDRSFVIRDISPAGRISSGYRMVTLVNHMGSNLQPLQTGNQFSQLVVSQYFDSNFLYLFNQYPYHDIPLISFRDGKTFLTKMGQNNFVIYISSVVYGIIARSAGIASSSASASTSPFYPSSYPPPTVHAIPRPPNVYALPPSPNVYALPPSPNVYALPPSPNVYALLLLLSIPLLPPS